KLKTDATEDITTTANNAKTSVQDTASTAVNSINTKATEATEYVDTKVTEFNQTVEDNGFVTPEKLTTDLDALTWQKYKLTNDDGTRKFLPKASFTDVTSLSPGFYETPTAQNATAQGFPPGISNEYTVFIDITKGTLGRTQIKVSQISNFKTFFKLIDANGIDRGWKEITNNQTDTGWIPFDLINGVKTNTVYTTKENPGFKCAYRIIKKGEKTKKMVRINGSISRITKL